MDRRVLRDIFDTVQETHMSSTNRGGKRSEADFYATPVWSIRRLVERRDLPGGAWLEPAAGDGAIIRAIDRSDIEWTAWELRERERANLVPLVPASRLHIGDFLAAHQAGALDDRTFDVAIMNPPFRLAREFIEACLCHAQVVVALARLNFLACEKRFAFMSQNTPSVYVLPNRPAFREPSSDSCEYGWFVWHRDQRQQGRVEILDLTPRAERASPRPRRRAEPSERSRSRKWLELVIPLNASGKTT
jgi:hypothetical protein